MARRGIAMDVVTGAFSYTGRYIAERLLASGRRVRTLSRLPAPAEARVEAAPLQFADPAALTAALRGARVLYNTYWIRFPYGDSTFERAVENSRTLFAAAARAGVERIVHVSVTNADERSPLPYFRGKAAVERALRESEVSHAIVRPTWIFGSRDILVSNLAWVLRRFPLLVVPGNGAYEVQPIAAEDVAALAVEAGDASDDVTFDAAGPERLAFLEVVRLLRRATRSRALVVRAHPRLALALARLVDAMTDDVLLTREEVAGLTGSLLTSGEPPRGRASFRQWIERHGDSLGREYVSELERNFRGYAPL